MIASLRQNFGYKLLAVLFAVGLHFYAASLAGAHPPHVLILPLSIRNLPPGVILDEKDVPPITLTLDGPADEISKLTDASVTASVDLAHARPGKTPPLTVRLAGLPPDVTTESDPKPVSLMLQPRRRRLLPVSAEDVGTAPANYAFTPAILSPREAVITGTREVVASVSRLVAQPDSDAAPGPVDDDFTLTAVDADGSPVGDVTIMPPTVHVRMGLTRFLARKSLVVSADVVGTLPAPYRFGSIQVSPAVVTAEGRPERLAPIGMLMTAPIDVSGATADIVRRVEPVVPPGVTFSPRGPITVTIRVIAPPAPAPVAPRIAPTPAAP